MAFFASTRTVISKSTIQSQNCQYGSHRDLLTHFLVFVEGDNLFFIYYRQTINSLCCHLLHEWFNFPKVEGISSVIFNCVSFVNV